MKRLILCFGLAIAASLAGCGQHHPHSHEAAEAETGVSFNAKSGLHVPPATAEFIGLEIAEVEERQIEDRLSFAARVYRTADEAAEHGLRSKANAHVLASGLVNPKEAEQLRPGQSVEVETSKGDHRPGHIRSVNRELQKAIGQVEVVLAIDDPLLSQGAAIGVTVPLRSSTVQVVPRSALLQTTQGHFVYTVSGNHFVRTAVELGAVDGSMAEVREGLYPGDRIVVQPAMTLWLAELQSIRGGKACADGH